MGSYLEVLLLWVPHMEDILQQSLMRHHAMCAEQFEESTIPQCVYASRISLGNSIIIIVLLLFPYNHFLSLGTYQKQLMDQLETQSIIKNS